MEAKRSKTKLVVSLLALGSTLAFLAFCMAGDSDLSIPTVLESEISVQAQLISSVPLTISQPGSYYLDQNMTHTNRYTNAIEVNADNVTIDLMGYSLIGPSSTSGTSNGIHMNGRKNVEIRNGTVTRFGNKGIYEENIGAVGHRVISVRVVSNGSSGINLIGAGHTIKNCTVSLNGLADSDVCAGIDCGYASSVTGNTVFKNGEGNTQGVDGITIGRGSTIADNIVAFSQRSGIWSRHGCTITGNTCYDNGTTGIYVSGNGSLVKGNTLRFNGNTNITVDGTHNAIEENLVTNSVAGIWFKVSGNFYTNNRALDNNINYDSAPGGSGDGGGNVAYSILGANSYPELQDNLEKEMQIRF